MEYDPQADVVANVEGMSDAAARILSGEVTQAVRDSTSPAGPIQQGDYIGLTRDGIVSVGANLADAASKLLERLVGDEHEIVTMIEGEGSSAADTFIVDVGCMRG